MVHERKFKRCLLLSICSVLIVSLFIGFVSAGWFSDLLFGKMSGEVIRNTGHNDFYKLDANAGIEIDEFDICKYVLSDSNASNYFIPTKTKVEWESFLNNLPAHVCVAECGETCDSATTSKTLNLSSDYPSESVTFDGKAFDVELVSASDTTATIAVTDSSGGRETKEIREAASKNINGLRVFVDSSEETNLLLSAVVTVSLAEVVGECTDSDDGENYGVRGVVFWNDTVYEDVCQYETDYLKEYVCQINTEGELMAMWFGYNCPNGCQDGACISGGDLIDGCNYLSDEIIQKIGELQERNPNYNLMLTDINNVETIFDNEGEYTVELVSASDSVATIKISAVNWVYDESKEIKEGTSKYFSSGFKIYVKSVDEINLKFSAEISITPRLGVILREGEDIHKDNYVVVPSNVILKLVFIRNQTTGYNNDSVIFEDMVSGDTLDTIWMTEGKGELFVNGNGYTVGYSGDASIASEDYIVTLDFPQSTGNDKIGFEDCEVCEAIGIRKGGSFCSLDKIWVEQQEADAICENSFECQSNVCVGNTCVSVSLWQKFLEWLQGIFG